MWLRLRGGKGVATSLGVLLALAWPVGVAACLSWLAGAAITRMSSASALLSALAAPVWAMLLGVPQIVALTIALTVIVFWRHSENIARLRAGTEPKIGQK